MQTSVDTPQGPGALASMLGHLAIVGLPSVITGAGPGNGLSVWEGRDDLVALAAVPWEAGPMTAGLWAGALHGVLVAAEVRPLAVPTESSTEVDRDRFVEAMYREHAPGLVRMARLFVDDRNAAEDLVQEAFIRLSRSAHRIREPHKAGAYLRSIVLNLARDHNRRGFVSLRHRLPLDERVAAVEDTVVVAEEHRQVLDALRDLPHRQRDCLILRYYDELGIDEIADTLGVSRNSVKTHLSRGMRALDRRLVGLHESEDVAR